MYIVSMTTHMSMHPNTNRMACEVSSSNIWRVIDGWCRGMLAGPSHADPGAARRGGDSARGGGRIPYRREVGRSENPGVDEDAGTSRFRGDGGGRHGDGRSSSEED